MQVLYKKNYIQNNIDFTSKCLLRILFFISVGYLIIGKLWIGDK